MKIISKGALYLVPDDNTHVLTLKENSGKPEFWNMKLISLPKEVELYKEITKEEATKLYEKYQEKQK